MSRHGFISDGDGGFISEHSQRHAMTIVIPGETVPATFFVNAYHTYEYRCGSEEGGRWATVYHHGETVLATNDRWAALRVCREKNAAIREEGKKWEEVACIETLPPEDHDDYTPYH